MTRIVRRGTTILIADDEPAMLQLTATFLYRSGYEVLTAQDGKAALKAFKEAQQTIQLVLSDVVMPGMRGPQLLHSINFLSPSTATLLMSAAPIDSDPSVASIMKRAG